MLACTQVCQLPLRSEAPHGLLASEALPWAFSRAPSGDETLNNNAHSSFSLLVNRRKFVRPQGVHSQGSRKEHLE